MYPGPARVNGRGHSERPDQGAMAGYVVGIVVMGVGGVLLLRDLFRRSESAAP